MISDNYQGKSVTDTADALREHARELLTLATYIETAQTDPDKERIVAAEQAAFAILRVTPEALRAIARLQNAAEDVISAGRDRRNELLDRLYSEETGE